MSMKHLLLLLISISLIPIASAGELSDSDAGTYELLKKDRTPSGALYRFTRSGDKWVVFGKLPGKDWKDVSCDSGCEYRISTKREIQAYFPPDWREINEIACIQNIAQAFSDSRPSTLLVGMVTYSLHW